MQRLLAVLCLLLWSLGEPALSAQKNDNLTFGNGGFELTRIEVEQLKPLALQGDGHAAARLWAYYKFASPDERNGKYWLIVGAEDGDAHVQYNLGSELSQSDDPGDKIRALFWLHKASRQGIALANDLIDELSGK